MVHVQKNNNISRVNVSSKNTTGSVNVVGNAVLYNTMLISVR